MKTEAHNCRVHESWPFYLCVCAVRMSTEKLHNATEKKRVEGPYTQLKRKYRHTGGQGVEEVREEELSGEVRGEQFTLPKERWASAHEMPTESMVQRHKGTLFSKQGSPTQVPQ